MAEIRGLSEGGLPLQLGTGSSLEGKKTDGGVPFGDVLTGLVHEAALSGRDAGARAQAMARGATDDLHGTVIAAKEAEITLKLVGTLRNKLLDAFQELWRTNV
jgi:flagellar hook-basal body complex protein FliE